MVKTGCIKKENESAKIDLTEALCSRFGPSAQARKRHHWVQHMECSKLDTPSTQWLGQWAYLLPLLASAKHGHAELITSFELLDKRVVGNKQNMVLYIFIFLVPFAFEDKNPFGFWEDNIS